MLDLVTPLEFRRGRAVAPTEAGAAFIAIGAAAFVTHAPTARGRVDDAGLGVRLSISEAFVDGVGDANETARQRA